MALVEVLNRFTCNLLVTIIDEWVFDKKPRLFFLCNSNLPSLNFDLTYLGLVGLGDQQACLSSKAELNICQGMAQCEESNREDLNRGRGRTAKDNNP